MISFMNVDLPAPLGPSRPVMPGGHGQRDVVQADDLAVPLRQMSGGHDRRGAPFTRPPRRRARAARGSAPESATSATIISSDSGHGVS